MSSIYEILLLIPILLFSLSLHEFSHGYISHKLGDPTPKAMGRLTINPLAHLDPIGSLVLIVTRRFGWAKPVPINPNYYKNPRQGIMLVSLAGPGSNFILAACFAFIARLVVFFSSSTIYQLQQSGYGNLIQTTFIFFQLAVIINLSLGFFNLIPVPPLDGSKILMGILPPKFDKYIHKLEGPYGMILLLLLAYTGILWSLIGPLVNFMYRLLLM
ncbi:site-2 protease family protein [Halanaerobium salsuginis]|jgi:Zn-dependent protease|uniref:Zn-dependent protease (Includes SpoIVFB) n=1 Tax=Halanaerobium salsuginis TaxID=29563 RepID=A0A1I4FBT2_9FIRM|nr:site-2 protease family protein [Halanaerobium salsuginis]SFL15435.1 Zn-dependent protease (includes SpoIVFB) [Halanaerobium salsuginis]